jgi:uncharacterized protein YdbL (DUF1318 family)
MKITALKIALTVAAMIVTTTMAFAAISLDAAKAQGLIGERPDGMLGIVSAATPEVKALVDGTNAERLTKYEGIAGKNGTPVDQVQALAGKKLIDNTPAGQFIMNAGGGWQKK